MQKYKIKSLSFILILVSSLAFFAPGNAQTILHTPDCDQLETLAAREVRKYIFQRTDRLLPLVQTDDFPEQGDIILLARDDHPLLDKLRDVNLEPCPEQGFIIKTYQEAGRNILIISGYDDQAVLYGAYRFAEHLGVRYDLAGDILPDKKIKLDITGYDEMAKPLLETRGIQPFHDFFQGPDLWGTADYMSVISQLPKLGMNFIGLHAYPAWSNTEEKKADIRQGPEPTVWIGLEEDVNPDGTVKWAYPSYYAHTHRPGYIWGYDTLGTRYFHAGANQLFDGKGFGSEVFDTGIPVSMEQSLAVFNRTGRMFNEAFTHAQHLRVKTAMGTELSLGLEPKGHSVQFDWCRVMPPDLQNKLKERGADPEDPDVVKEVYKGIFTRIMKTHPLDYYWLWSWEVWSMHDPASKKQLKAFKEDIRIAQEALQEVGAPFQLGLAGWILGTDENPAVFDDILPPEAPFFGLWDEAQGFEELSTDRIKWPASWLEEDWGLIQPQLELHRIYNDIKAAHAKSCNGLIAKHWRTRGLAGNVSSMKDLLWAYSQTGSAFTNTFPANKSDWIDSFYADWSHSQFGPEAARRIAAIFASLDKAGEPGNPGAIPHVSGWDTDVEQTGGAPGAIMPNEETWSNFRDNFRFVEELEALRPEIRGKGNLDRFDYWLCTMQILKAEGEYGCLRYLFEQAMEEEDWTRALEYRKDLARLFEEIITHQVEKAVNVSDLGEIVNMEILNWHQLMESKWDATLSQGLGRALPAEAFPSPTYTGQTSIKLMTRQTQVRSGESLELRVLIAGKHSNPLLKWRPLGSGAYRTLPLKHVAKGVYQLSLPEMKGDFEYYIQAGAGKDRIVYPASAPEINQALVVIESE